MIACLAAFLLGAAHAAEPDQPAEDRIDVRLDLGPEDGLVMDGFVGITPWTPAPRTRWEARPKAARGGIQPDPLVGDGIVGGTLHLDLPPGTYRVGALFDDVTWRMRPKPGHQSGLRIQDRLLVADTLPQGDAWFVSRQWGRVTRPVFEPDQTAWDRQLRGAWAWRFDQVQVGEQGLTLQIEGLPLSALIVTTDDAATLEVEVAQIDARRGLWWNRHRPSVREELPGATEGLLGLEVLEWDERPSLQPAGIDAQARLARAAAPGRRLTGLLAVHGSDAPAQVRLQGPQGWELDLFEVTWLDATEERVIRARPHVLHPLDPAGDELVAGQGLVPLLGWAVRIPDTAEPGPQALRLVVSRGSEQVQLDLDVRVRDLTLEAPASRIGFWADLHGPTAGIYGPDSERARAVWSESVRLMRERGAVAVGLRGTFFPGDWFDPGDEIPAHRLTWAAQAWREQGGQDLVWVDPSFTIHRAQRRAAPDEPPLDQAALQSINDFERAASAVDASLYVVDEAVARDGPDAIPRYRTLFQQVDQATTVPLAGAVPHPGGWSLASELLDIVYINRRPYLSADSYRWFEGRRATAWAYNLGVGREASGRMPWVLGAEGVLLWHLNEHHGDPYVQLELKDWMFVIPAPDHGTVLPLRRLELFSEGVEDHRVLSTLAARVHELQGRRRQRIRDEVDRACQILRAARSGVEGIMPGDWSDQAITQGRSLTALRQLAGDQAEVLSTWSRRQRRQRRGVALPDIPRTFPERCSR